MEPFQIQVDRLRRQLIRNGAQPVPMFAKVEQNAQNHQAQSFDQVFRLYHRIRINRLPGLDRLSLDEAIVQLPHGYRLVFVLHDVEGLEHSEIASLLACSIGTSKSQLHRARVRMRLLLKKRMQPRSTDDVYSQNEVE